MDESWRMHMGHNLPRRRSTEETSSDRMRRSVFGVNSSESETLNPDDFNDVFGGPPRSVIYRKLSCDFANNRSSSSTSTFYEGVFQSSKFVDPTKEVGRNLPVFRIPSMSLSSATREGVSRTTTDTDDDGFYNDIFGSDEDRRSKSNSNWKSKSKSKSKSQSKSKSKSKSNSSSVLSSEDLSPLRPSIAEDVFFSSFSSKLRPINVGRNSSSTLNREQQNIHRTSDAPWPRPPFTAFQYMENDQNENYKSSKFGFSRSGSSPETISLDPNSYQSIKVSMDDLETDSPSSVISSSLCRDPESKTKVQDKALQEEEEEEEEEVMGSYVIEITSERMDESVDIDEAIAWAKEKFQTQSLESMDGGNQKQNMRQTATEPELEPFAEREERYISDDHLEEQRGGDGRMQFLVANEQLMRWKIEEPQQSEKDMEMELLEETIRLWSAGRDGNIRLLLSTLHNILWPSSGWYAIPLTNLLETSDVKKAYQKARLCLHPDKIQQRGATLPQKYVAEKAFAILQDAWASFISQDILG